jgi:hypothetical protein
MKVSLYDINASSPKQEGELVKRSIVTAYALPCTLGFGPPD